jgi:hypothetical protein
MAEGTFGTVLNCMDGRVQRPVSEAACSLFGVDYVDTITEAGIVSWLAGELDPAQTKPLFARIRVSVEKHGSRAIAVAAHDDCAGNPVDEAAQRRQLLEARDVLGREFFDCRVIALWVGADWVAQTVEHTASR